MPNRSNLGKKLANYTHTYKHIWLAFDPESSLNTRDLGGNGIRIDKFKILNPHLQIEMTININPTLLQHIIVNINPTLQDMHSSNRKNAKRVSRPQTARVGPGKEEIEEEKEEHSESAA